MDPSPRPNVRYPVEPPASVYAAAVDMVLRPGMPEDPMLGAFVGLTRVLLELAADTSGSPSSRELLRAVAANLTAGVEDPNDLVPT